MNGVKPLDARLAYRLVYPLRDTRVTPNHLTTLRLAFGIAAALLLIKGGYYLTNLAALCFVISLFLDHADGELARLTDNKSRFGHNYDLFCDLTVTALLFISAGIGLTRAAPDSHALFMGLVAGLSATIAVLVNSSLYEFAPEGKDATMVANSSYFELEDVMYLFPLITLADQLQMFLLLAATGAPAFALWVVCRYLIRKARK